MYKWFSENVKIKQKFLQNPHDWKAPVQCPAWSRWIAHLGESPRGRATSFRAENALNFIQNSE